MYLVKVKVPARAKCLCVRDYANPLAMNHLDTMMGTIKVIYKRETDKCIIKETSCWIGRGADQ